VESIVSSAPKGAEVLIIDDGSTDSITLSAVKSLARLPAVQVLHKRNGGCASARNYGLKRAKGRYIAFVDGDDFVSQDFLPLLLETININASNIGEVAFSTFFQRNKRVVENPEPYSSNRVESGFLDNLWLVLRRQPSIWRRLYRRQWLLDNSLYFPEHISAYDDLEFQFLTLFLNKGTSFNSTSCYFYRKDRENQDVAAADARHFGTFNMLIRLETFLRERRVSQETIILFDLFALDCLTWSYELLHESLQPTFVSTVINYLFGQRSVNRVNNIYWEVSKDLSKPLFYAICNEVNNEDAAVEHSKSGIHFADQVYDYRFPAELAKA
jgi:glycosyltransferase involved in cell wall biosynthesis